MGRGLIGCACTRGIDDVQSSCGGGQGLREERTVDLDPLCHDRPATLV